MQGGGSSPWLSEFETFLEKLDRENLARATMPKLPQPPQLQGNQDCQLKPQLASECEGPPQDIGGEAERSLAWRIPLLRFIIEARTLLNVATSDHRVRQRIFSTLTNHMDCFCDFMQTQVQEGLVKLRKEHFCPEGGLPLSGFDLCFLEN